MPSRRRFWSWGGPLIQGRFVDRPNRFLIRIQFEPDGSLIEAHLADPGRLVALLVPGCSVWLRQVLSPNRRTKWTAVLVQDHVRGALVSVNTTLPNKLIELALRSCYLDELAGWKYERSEFSAGRSRLDFLLTDNRGDSLALEVKSVTLVDGDTARFPDAPTARGARHVDELSELAGRPGWSAAVLFVVQRDDARRMEAARDIDPSFADALCNARSAGVLVFARSCSVSLDALTLGQPIPVL